MDKRKYLSKTLIAQYEFFGSFDDEDKFIELAYKLKDNSIIIEFSGAKHSIYGVKIDFKKYIGRNGVYKISDEDFKWWKHVRAIAKGSNFIDW